MHPGRLRSWTGPVETDFQGRRDSAPITGLTGWNWIGYGNNRVPSHRIQTNAKRAIGVAQEQDRSLLTGFQSVGQVPGWKVPQIVFVGGTCGSIHVELFYKNMKTLGVLASNRTPFVRRSQSSASFGSSRLDLAVLPEPVSQSPARLLMMMPFICSCRNNK